MDDCFIILFVRVEKETEGDGKVPKRVPKRSLIEMFG